MTLDYNDNINAYDENIIRLYDFDMHQAKQLKESIAQTLLQDKKQLILTKLDFIQGRNCKLTLRVSDEDLGIHTTDKINFICDMTLNGYEEMIALIAPFCTKKSIGHQYLYDLDTPTDFLFSPGGTW